ncbi:MAG: transposase [Planctomycetaceae bacterium]|nr:transposase [Planctomycetaceae bacterium]
MRDAFIDDHRQQWPVSVQCRVLNVSRSGFYAGCACGESITAQRRAELAERIREVHQESRQTYGSPRVHAELLAQGRYCNRKTVAKCMRDAGFQPDRTAGSG